MIREFPKDFPDEFKMCCWCHMVAGWLIEGNTDLETNWYRFRASKIKKLITVFGNERKK